MSNDTLSGGSGDDTIFGGIGDDVIMGGLGADLMDGGADTDRLSYADATSRVVVDMLNGSVTGAFAAGDVFFNFENLEGGTANDLLLGDNAANVIYGGGDGDEHQGSVGYDALIGGRGAATHEGGGDVDTASYETSNAAVNVNFFNGTALGGHAAGDVFNKVDNLIGSDFGDTLPGSFSNNQIEGGAGGDVIDGGAGFDIAGYADSAADYESTVAIFTGIRVVLHFHDILVSDQPN